MFLYGYASTFTSYDQETHQLATQNKLIFKAITILGSIITGNSLAGVGFVLSIYVYEVFPNNVSTVNAFYEAFIGVGAYIGPTLAGILKNECHSFYGIMKVVSFSSLMGIFLIWCLLPELNHEAEDLVITQVPESAEAEPLHQNSCTTCAEKRKQKLSEKMQEAEQPETIVASTTSFQDTKNLLKNPAIILAIIVMTVNIAVMEFISTIYPVFLNRWIFVAEPEINEYFSISGICTAIFCFAVGYYCDTCEEEESESSTLLPASEAATEKPKQRARLRKLMIFGTLLSTIFIFLSGFGVKYVYNLHNQKHTLEFKMFLGLLFVLMSLSYALSVIPVFLELKLCASESKYLKYLSENKMNTLVSATASIASATAPIFGSGFASHGKKLVEKFYLNSYSETPDEFAEFDANNSTELSQVQNQNLALSSLDEKCSKFTHSFRNQTLSQNDAYSCSLGPDNIHSGSYEITAALYSCVLLVLTVFMLLYYFVLKK